jgi:hypothetical protein
MIKQEGIACTEMPVCIIPQSFCALQKDWVSKKIISSSYDGFFSGAFCAYA